MQQPKILVGCPTSEHKAYCLPEYAEAIKSLTYPHYDILLVDNSATNDYSEKIKQFGLPVVKDIYLPRARQRITHSRNILREHVLEKGYDYFLCLEQDVIPPSNVIELLLAHQKSVVTGVYFTRYFDHGKPLFRPLLWEHSSVSPDTMRFVSEETLRQNQLISAFACGLGCILIHRSVLEKISFHLFTDKKTYDDMPFCADLRDHQIQLFADTAVKCKHLISGMKWEDIEE